MTYTNQDLAYEINTIEQSIARLKSAGALTKSAEKAMAK